MFIDNIKIIESKGNRFIQKLKNDLTTAFSMLDIGPISFYLGLKIELNQKKRAIKLS